MRIALISMMDDVPGQVALPEFAGKSIALRQAEFALALECEGVVCLAPRLGPEQIALQHAVEAAGARFSCISDPHALPSLVRGAEHLLVLAPGLLPLADEARAELAKGDRILVLPADSGTAAGFERLDLNHVWAGVLSMPGNLANQIVALPSDYDAISALLRIAAQARIPERLMPERLLAAGQWALLGPDGDAAEREKTWVRGRIAAHGDPTISGWLARLAAKIFGPAKATDPRIGKTFLVVSPLLMAGAAVLGQFDWFAAAFGLLGLGWLGARISALFTRLREDVWKVRPTARRISESLAIIYDIVLVYIGFIAGSGPYIERLFAPLVLVGMVRLSSAFLPRRVRFFAGDRALIALVLAIAAPLGALPEALQLLALALLAMLMVSTIRNGSANASLTKQG